MMYIQLPSLIIKNLDIKPWIYEAPDAMTPTSLSLSCNIRLHRLIPKDKIPSLEIPLIKPSFLLQNHPQHHWKHIRTEGGLPVMRVKQLEQRFRGRGAPIFLI